MLATSMAFKFILLFVTINLSLMNVGNDRSYGKKVFVACTIFFLKLVISHIVCIHDQTIIKRNNFWHYDTGLAQVLLDDISVVLDGTSLK